MNTAKQIKTKILKSFEKGVLPASIVFHGTGSQKEKDDFVISVSDKILKIKRNLSDDKFRELALSNSLPDFVLISKGSTGSIKVDDIHKIDDIIKYKPFESENRIVYIKESETMTVQAQNSLLKKIEEPAEKTYYFLTTAKKNNLLPTIVSRCVSFYVPEVVDGNDTLSPQCFFPFIKDMYDLFGTEFVNSEKKLIELQALEFNHKSLSSLQKSYDRITELNFDEFGKEEYIKKTVIKMRLAFFSFFLKNKYPDIAERIALFLNNRQFFSLESSVFYNIIGDEIGK